ncbi:MAG: sodium-dependent transporter [Ruminococcaceae bacterium]|nr:sodium-dependent transporter [Oscillospiraceae bacterium]
MEREKLSSRLGFILISAGCAIGIGNVWKFPYMVGQNGGGIFVLIYLLFLLILGVPALSVEFTLGRAAKKSPAKLYQALEKPGQKWHIHGYAAVAANYLLMMFYTVVSGWMIHYLVLTAGGRFEGLNPVEVEGVFDTVCADPVTMVLYMGIAVVLGFLVCGFGVQNGLERVSKIMMSALLIIMVVLAVNSASLPGGQEGLMFYLKPDLGKLQERGIINVVLAAMNQAFFTLSIGIGSMAIFGSYIGRERSILGESVTVSLLDTFVALMSGVIIFPACSAFGVKADAGPKLLFVVLPNIFNNMPFGRVWGSLFFVFMTFAAMSTVFAVFENLISCSMEIFNISRRKSCIINCVVMFALSLPCALGFNLLGGFKPFGGDTTVLNLEDFLVSNILLPLGALVYILFCVSKNGFGWNKFVEEANQGKGLKIHKWMKWHYKIVLPVIIIVVFLMGLITFNYAQ